MKLTDKIKRLRRWHSWFAWRPVRVHGRWVIMKKIYRRGNYAYPKPGRAKRLRWEYRLKDEGVL